MVEKGFNSWRGPMEGASGSAVGQVSKRVKAKELAPQEWRVGQDQHWEESGSDDEDSVPGGHGFCLQTVGGHRRSLCLPLVSF